MNSSPKVLSTAIQLPPYTKDTDEIIKDMEGHLEGQDERFKRKILRIFKYAQVDRRYSIIPAEEVLGNLSFEEKNDRYVEGVTTLAEQVLKRHLIILILTQKKSTSLSRLVVQGL